MIENSRNSTLVVSPKFFDFDFQVDIGSDPYGRAFWECIEDGSYEPDTIDFLRRHMEQGVNFFDIGAANGAMTLIAASLGAQVHSFEPMIGIYQVLEQNINLNPLISHNISIYKKAISFYDGSISTSSTKRKNVISQIVIENTNMESQEIIEVASLTNILRDVNYSNVCMKIDIEGAEYALLNDSETLIQLSKSKVTLLLALHPGFLRPYTPSKKITGKTERLLWRIQNLLDNYKLYSKVSKHGTIFRSNEVRVSSASKFILLAASGVFEFTVKFGT